MNSLTLISLSGKFWYNTLILILYIFFLVLLYVCTGFTCYNCTVGSTGCDPFNKDMVNITSGHGFCIVNRYILIE